METLTASLAFLRAQATAFLDSVDPMSSVKTCKGLTLGALGAKENARFLSLFYRARIIHVFFKMCLHLLRISDSSLAAFSARTPSSGLSNHERASCLDHSWQSGSRVNFSFCKSMFAPKLWSNGYSGHVKWVQLYATLMRWSFSCFAGLFYPIVWVAVNWKGADLAFILRMNSEYHLVRYCTDSCKTWNHVAWASCPSVSYGHFLALTSIYEMSLRHTNSLL